MSKLDEPTEEKLELIAWAFRLHAEMAEKQASYDAEKDVSKKAKIISASLATVVSALLELSLFRDENVHLPLKDLIHALRDLGQGRRNPLFEPVNVGGTNISTSSADELKGCVQAIFQIMTENGFNKSDAFKRIATGLNGAGYPNRKGKPLSWQTVRNWCNDDETPIAAQMLMRFRETWSNYILSSGLLEDSPELNDPKNKKLIAGCFADLCWKLPQLRELPISPHRNGQP